MSCTVQCIQKLLQKYLLIDNFLIKITSGIGKSLLSWRSLSSNDFKSPKRPFTSDINDLTPITRNHYFAIHVCTTRSFTNPGFLFLLSLNPLQTQGFFLRISKATSRAPLPPGRRKITDAPRRTHPQSRKSRIRWWPQFPNPFFTTSRGEEIYLTFQERGSDCTHRSGTSYQEGSRPRRHHSDF